MTEYDAGAVADFPEGRITVVTVGGVDVGVANWQGKFYVVRNLCPHQSAPVGGGSLFSRLGSTEVGSVTTARSEPIISCPWHGWEFEAETGKCLSDDRMHLRRYDVQTRDGRVFVDLGRKRL